MPYHSHDISHYHNPDPSVGAAPALFDCRVPGSGNSLGQIPLSTATPHTLGRSSITGPSVPTTSGASGGSGPHNNTQPTVILWKIIYVGRQYV